MPCNQVVVHSRKRNAIFQNVPVANYASYIKKHLRTRRPVGHALRELLHTLCWCVLGLIDGVGASKHSRVESSLRCGRTDRVPWPVEAHCHAERTQESKGRGVFFLCWHCCFHGLTFLPLWGRPEDTKEDNLKRRLLFLCFFVHRRKKKSPT